MAVYRALEGDGPVPFTLWVSRLCEEFQCLPSEAYAEWRRLPVGALEDILEARAFARTKAMLDRSDAQNVPETPMVRLVKAVMEQVALDDIHATNDD